MKTLIRMALALISATLPLMAYEPQDLRAAHAKLIDRGLWRDAEDFYQDKLRPISDDKSGDDLSRAVTALARLGEWAEFDPLVEGAIATHPENPELLNAAGAAYRSAPHSGRLIAGDFERDANRYRPRRGRGPAEVPEASANSWVATDYRDRVRSFQLSLAAITHEKSDTRRGDFWRDLGSFLQSTEAWKLQTLTPLAELPEWGEPGPEGGTEGAPWSGDGPVVYAEPASWDAAKSDGERWRYALAESTRLIPATKAWEILSRARFSESQFGVGTMARFGWWRQMDPESAKGILALDTLAEDECLAQTSDGVRRFKLPADQHFIALYRSIFDEDAPAADALVAVFLNRRQYDKAVETLEKAIAKHGPGTNDERKDLLAQVKGNLGHFDPAANVAAGTKPVVPLVFRNAREIHLTAQPVDLEQVLRDAMAHLKSNPRELDWQQVNVSNVAWRMLKKGGNQYLGKPAAEWDAKLEPRENYRTTRTEIEVPLDKAGAWWITGKLAEGNTFHTLVHIVDSVLVSRDVAGKKQWWVADAKSGAPVEGAEIEFFGYRTIYLERSKPGQRNMDIRVKDFKRTTDADGKTLLKRGDYDDQYQWLAIARKDGNSPAYYGFQNYNISEPQLENGNRDIGYGISDRPLYKPGDTVHLKFYLRSVGYFEPDEDRYANKPAQLYLNNGRGEQVIKLENLKADALGSFETDVIIPKDGGLGTWTAIFQIPGKISASVALHVEEFRKPEYEVKVEAPDEPVKLGEKFTATVKATYFHGQPVREADVEITVKRGSLGERWFPAWRWDWLYGKGAWWNGGEARWHPGWSEWGCIPPHPSWWQGNRWTPDELVLKKKTRIGADGTAKVEIDTAAAKAIHGDMDASYTIEARVVDASRREEIGTGTVIAARKPFEVIVWTDRGYTRAGEEIHATVSAATLAGKPVVEAKGTLKIYEILTGENGLISEKEIRSFDISTDKKGEIQQTFAAPATGQYRLAASLAKNGGEAAEGAIILNVQAPGRADPADWHFGPLELIADKPVHAAGETMKLRVNSDQTDANVWLFLHITGSAGREARRIRLDGKSLEVEVPLDARDMPNMYIEGITVFDAEVHTAVREVLLPPVSKTLEVTLEPAKDRVKPGEESKLGIVIKDADGKPFTGIAVLTVYDKSLEAITGGSNVGSIQENFWNWQNAFYPNYNRDSLPQMVGNLQFPKERPMRQLGIFGELMERNEFGKDGAARAGAFGVRSRMSVMDESAGMDAFAEAAPATAAPRMLMKSEAKDGQVEAAAKPIMVRKDFADLLKWNGAVKTDENGRADIPLEFPDNLTTWKARVWALGSGTRVGEGEAEIITSKDLLIRLQAPRFLVETDEAVLSAVVQNDHDSPKTVNVSLELDGTNLELIEGGAKSVEIAAKSEARVDWRVRAVREGEATIRMKADAGDDGDAVERKLPVLVHGMLRQDAWSRMVAPEQDSAKIEMEVPEERRPEQSKLTVRFSPTVAGAVVDAIPYLASYPHGCTEQTLNRFVPAVISQKMLKDLGIDLAAVKAKRNNLNPQELGDPKERAEQWKQWQENPVFDEVELEKMVSAGLDKLMSMQMSDGGWGWFSGYGERSWPHTTAVVVHGLIIAKANGAKVPDGMLNPGIAWLQAYERKQVAALQLYVENLALRDAGKKVPRSNRYEKSNCDALDAFVRLVLGEAKRDSVPMLAFLYRDRLELPVYAKCLMGLEMNRTGDDLRRDEVMKIISQFLKRDEENQTAYLDLHNSNYWWYWYGSEVEAQAWYLKLLAAVKPKDADTRGLVKYLVNNRKHASYWESTRDTAYAIEAIADYFKASGESAPEMEVEVLLDGKSLRKISIDKDNMFSFDGTIELNGENVTTGKHEVELRRTGKGTLYANAYLQVFTLEEKLRAAGLEVKVARHFWKLVPQEKDAEVPDSTGLVATQKVERFRREALADGAEIASGDRFEVELVLESKNDYEYLIFSDAKAAGAEALDALSGYVDGGGLPVYMEPRDKTVDFFLRTLPRGTHTLRYQLRAEAPGIYHALPAIAEGMYAPELRANSEDFRLGISEAPVAP